jgi:hypothetical protein
MTPFLIAKGDDTGDNSPLSMQNLLNQTKTLGFQGVLLSPVCPSDLSLALRRATAGLDVGMAVMGYAQLLAQRSGDLCSKMASRYWRSDRKFSACCNLSDSDGDIV